MNLPDFIPPGSVIFDIGAYQGAFTMQCLEAGAGQVVAVEPQPDVADYLRRLFSGEPRVTVIERAVYSHNVAVDLILCSSMRACTTTQEKWKHGRFAPYTWGRTIQVQAVTLDRLIASFGAPAFVKIDVEGAETQALAGLTKPVRALSFEWTHEYLEDALACIERLEQLGRYEYSFTWQDAAQDVNLWGERAGMLMRVQAEIRPAAGNTWGMIYARLVE